MTPTRPLAGVSYLLPAAVEYQAQRTRYRLASQKVEESFVDAINAGERLALGNPLGFAIVDERKKFRAVVIRRFPFRLVYAWHDETVIVVAIAHTARHPAYFRDRF